MDVFAIYSSGGFAREIKTEFVISQKSSSHSPFKVIFIDDFNYGKIINGCEVISYEHAKKIDNLRICVALSDGRKRKEKIDQILMDNIKLFSISAPSAIYGDNVDIGESSIFASNTIVTCDTKIGLACHTNIYSYIAHDCIIGDYVTLAPRVSLNGRIKVGDYSYIGSDATFLPGKLGNFLEIGEGSVIGAGAVVTKDVDPYTVVVGNPAKPIKKLPLTT